MRLRDKVAVVVGAGQTPGETIGNGRATSILYAREGARVLLVDRHKTSAEETLQMVEEAGGSGSVVEADATREGDCRAVMQACTSSGYSPSNDTCDTTTASTCSRMSTKNFRPPTTRRYR